jgi:hypothetical protein
MSKWIEFTGGNTIPGGKTKLWEVRSKDQSAVLGEVKWYGPWRQYTYFANPHTIYERQCLRDIADFCERETRAQFQASRAAKAEKKAPTLAL